MYFLFYFISIIIQGIPYYAYNLPLFVLEIYGLSYFTHQLVWPPWCCALGWSFLGYEYKDPQAALLSFLKSWILSSRHLGEHALPPFLWRGFEGISGSIYHVPFFYIFIFIIIDIISLILFAILSIIKFLLILFIEYIRHILLIIGLFVLNFLS